MITNGGNDGLHEVCKNVLSDAVKCVMPLYSKSVMQHPDPDCTETISS